MFPILKMTEADRMSYYEQAMKAGLNSRLQIPFFTTVGKIRVKYFVKLKREDKVLKGSWISHIHTQVKVPKYNNPRTLYSDDTMDEMVSGTSSIE